MSDKLTPLTPEQQEEFERRRETDFVLQTKCTACGAWYETYKKGEAFTESFFCDCGTFMQFTVPPMPAIVTATAQEIAAQAANGILDTGMKVEELLRLTEKYWDGIGRRLMAHIIQKQGAEAFASLDPDDPNFLPSGLLHGKPWDELNRREKLMIAKVYHHFMIRKPQTL